MTTEPAGTYALRLSDAELTRYRMMAEVARDTESELWELAGIRAGRVFPSRPAIFGPPVRPGRRGRAT